MEPDKGGKRHSALTILKTLKRRKFCLLAPMVLVTAAVAVYTARLPERFRAKALVASETAAPEPYLGGRVDAVATVDVQEHLRAVRAILFSPPLLETVVREFNLYDVRGTGATERATNALKARIQIQVDSPDSFYVGFEGDRAEQVTQVANRLAALFVERTSDLHGERVAQVDSLLDEEVNRLRTQLADQEEGLKRYQQSVAQELPDRLAANLKLLENLQQQSQNKSDQIAEAQARRLAVVDEIASLTNQGALEPSQRQKTVNETNLDDLRLKLTQLKTRYTAENPEIQKAEKAVRELEALGTSPGARSEPSPLHMRYIALEAELTSIDQRVKSYQQERAALVSQMANYEQRIDSSPGRQTTLGQRTRDAALTRTQYETMLSKQQAQKLDQRVEKTTRHAAFRVIEPAEVPSAPYSPQRARMIFMGFAAGLGIGLALIMFVEQMDTSFESIEEVRGFTSIPVLSAIPTITNKLPKIRPHRHPIQLEPQAIRSNGLTLEERQQFQTHRLTVLSDPQSIASQQYGILKLKVQRWREQTEGRVLIVTSAAGGEGKSLTALNLSIALAGSPEGRVLLVDCDLRRPQVHERLGLKDQKGLSDLLALSDCNVDPFIAKVGNLWVMPGGTHLSDPAGLLSSRRMREILARLRDEYQLIVFDSPPIVPIADSYLLSGLADAAILVIRARQTRRELLQLAVESFGAANIVGIVLNDVEYGNTPYAYAYQYYQRHYMSRR